METHRTPYRPRLADTELRDRLGAAAAVLIEGPKASGKTATARQAARSEVFFDLDSVARQAASLDPQLVIAGAAPRLLDEWQLVPDIWNHVRRAADLAPGMGRFILTGSAVPTDDLVRHTGAGRIARMRLHTMSLLEQGRGSGEVSLGDLLEGRRISASEPGLTLPDVVEAICRGGWPATLHTPSDRAMRYVRDYVDEVRRTDVERASGVHHDPNQVLRLMQSLARNIATDVAVATLARDVSSPDRAIQERTVALYLDALERLFVVENQPSFSPHLRSRSRLRTTPKRHFCDPSVAVAALRAGPDRLLKDLNFLGLLFESLVVRDLRVYATAHDAEVRHYRDNTGLEVDAVVETAAGDWMPVEVKLGGETSVDAAARNLLKLRDRVDQTRMGEPTKLVVVTATGYGYEREDGVTVVPVGALGP